MKRLFGWITLCALSALLATSQTAQAADPMSGKWELNVAASMYDPGPGPKSTVRTQTVDAESITVTADVVDSDGASRQMRYTAKLDGADYPITGVPNADTIAMKRIDARTLEFTAKKGGKTTTTGKHQVSEDGSELTISMKGKDAKGEETNDLSIYDKR